MDIKNYAVESGRIIGEDGKIYNKADLLKAAGSSAVPVSDEVLDITQFAPKSGRIIGEDGKVYNEVDLLKGIQGGGSSYSYTKAESDAKYIPNGGNSKTGMLDLSRDVIMLSGNNGLSLFSENVGISGDNISLSGDVTLVDSEGIGGLGVNNDGISLAPNGKDIKLFTDTGRKAFYKTGAHPLTPTADDEIATRGFVEDYVAQHSSSYSETVLWENTTQSNNPDTITLSDSVFNYDAITIIPYHVASVGMVFPHQAINTDPDGGYIGVIGAWALNTTYASAYYSYIIMNDGVTLSLDGQKDVSYPYSIRKVVGLKFGGGGGTVDSALNTQSANPVTNSAVTAAINALTARIEALEGS